MYCIFSVYISYSFFLLSFPVLNANIHVKGIVAYMHEKKSGNLNQIITLKHSIIKIWSSSSFIIFFFFAKDDRLWIKTSWWSLRHPCLDFSSHEHQLYTWKNILSKVYIIKKKNCIIHILLFFHIMMGKILLIRCKSK